jgi:hypothetical protein
VDRFPEDVLKAYDVRFRSRSLVITSNGRISIRIA